MNERESDNLDELLVRWSDTHEPTEERLNELNRQIVSSLRPHSNQVKPVPGEGLMKWPQRRLVALGAAAAVVACVSAFLWVSGKNPNGPESGRESLAVIPDLDTNVVPIEKFSSEQRIQKSAVLSELDRLFSDKRVWFAETDSDVILGGDSKRDSTQTANDATVAMRLVLAKRASHVDSWERVWTADVISRSDQVVQFHTDDPLQPAASFTAWAHLLPDGLVACDVDLKWDNGIPAQLRDSLLLSPDSTTPGASLSIDDVEYRLFHAVALLGEAKT